jgi:putative redox protein
MNVTVKWLKNARMLGQTGSGHEVSMDGPESIGGQNLGARPMEMVLLGLGGCAMVDVVSILQKSRQNVRGCHVEISAQRAENQVPAVFTDIHLHFVVSGDGLKSTQVARAVSLSAEKYCSVSKMLEKTATISHDYEVLS